MNEDTDTGDRPTQLQFTTLEAARDDDFVAKLAFTHKTDGLACGAYLDLGQVAVLHDLLGEVLEAYDELPEVEHTPVETDDADARGFQ